MQSAARKQFTLKAPPQLSPFTDELNDYEDDDDEEYEGVDGGALDQFEEDGDDDSLLAEQLGAFLGTRASTAPQSSDLGDENLLDLLQKRLFAAREAEEPPRVESLSPRRSTSITSSLEDFLAERVSRQKSLKQKLDQDAQRALLDTFSQEPSKAPPLSPQRVAQMTTRFRIFEEKKARRLTAKRRETETQENNEFRFAPTMNNKSRQLTSQFPTFAERQATLLAKKRQQRARLDKQREELLTRDRAIDLQESVKTPCICSHGNTSRSDSCAMGAEREPSPSKTGTESPASPVDAVRHTQACMRFMAMCTKMNTSFTIQRKKDMMKRSLDDIIAYQEDKKQRQKARAAIEKAKEDKETTFTPQINAKSEKIYAALIRSGKLDTELAGRMFKPRKTPPLPPKLTFQPTISKKSKWLLKKKQRELIASAESDTLDGKGDVIRPTSPLHLDVFSRLQQLSHHRENEAQRLQRAREEEKLKTKPPVEWTVIPYDAASCRFILQGFDRPNALS
ncbi:hypothetical protein PR003_g6941 [Phytophthora rubi]|uniref:Uncharacterized protein n=1 Tax=Phytophthora rubi TaxID=129364 RepID=A0A6A3NAL1_9STRA|nr:hypothetical protein PR002_g6233 [Phytophthora rubi]KAE9041383.1 hypothetical protein PR001_g6644 [Phytophthora rubi]KAE9347422.1 hypothetical protein PR003_g6941 [Phytophthora rubi]